MKQLVMTLTLLLAAASANAGGGAGNTMNGIAKCNVVSQNRGAAVHKIDILFYGVFRTAYSYNLSIDGVRTADGTTRGGEDWTKFLHFKNSHPTNFPHDNTLREIKMHETKPGGEMMGPVEGSVSVVTTDGLVTYQLACDPD